jgi:hypothetical protein
MHSALIPPEFLEKTTKITTAPVEWQGRLTIKKCQNFVALKSLSGNSAMARQSRAVDTRGD